MGMIGSRVLRVEDPHFLRGAATYTDNFALPGALWATFVRSSQAHGRISHVDASDSTRFPGVVAVYTAADIDLAADVPKDLPVVPDAFRRPWLASEVVRYVGEPVAVILSGTRAQGADAAEGVIVEYEPFRALVDVESALADDVLIHPEAGTNLCLEAGDEPLDFDACDVVVRQRIINSKVAVCPLETQAAIAWWESGPRLEIRATSQSPHLLKRLAAQVYAIEDEYVHVISPDVGGGFGGKAFPAPEQLLLPWLARKASRPVRWSETRSESMLSIGHGRGQVQDVVIGGTRDGRLQAYDLTIIQDVGAYPRVSTMLPMLTKLMHPGAYAIPRTRCRLKSVVTNTVPMGSFRGAGRPEAAAAIERAVDLFATEIGMDPSEVRRKNLIRSDAFPWKTTTGATYDSGDYQRALDLALEAVSYPELRQEQARRRAAGDGLLLGVGMATYVEITAPNAGTERARVALRSDGGATVVTGSFSHGQGHATGWSMIVSDRTGIALADIDVLQGDTDLVDALGLTGGSRSVQVVGSNVLNAANSLVELARAQAAHLLEADPADVALDASRGLFHVVGVPSKPLSWGEVATAAAKAGSPLTAEGDAISRGPSFPSGTHVAVVEVDIETGLAKIRRFVAVDDAGRILNPLLAEGQVHGGVAQGIAQALMEEFVYDDDGNPLTTNFADYPVISAAELPLIETVHVETPSPHNELGAKGIGESGSIGATPAVQNAIIDALHHLGIRHIDMPLSPERVWRAATAAIAMLVKPS